MKEIIKKVKSVNNERGMALVAVLMVFVVISILGVSLMGMAATNLKMSTGERNNQSAYYVAESGITHIMNKIITTSSGYYSTITDQTSFFNEFEDDFFVDTTNFHTYNQFESSFGQDPEATIKIQRIDSNPDTSTTREYKITSIGKIDTRSRTVEKKITVRWIPKKIVVPENTAIVVNNTIELKNTQVIGSIGVYATLDSIIYGNGSKTEVTGEEFVTPVKIPMPPFPVFPAEPSSTLSFTAETSQILTLNPGVSSYNNFTIKPPSNKGTTTLTIDVGNTDKSIVVNNLNIDGNITISGTGKLNIYVKNNLTINSTSIINEVSKIGQLELFLKGSGSTTSPKTISNQGWKLYGSIFAEDANISPFENNTGIQGNIITGGRMIDQIKGTDNEVPRLLFAPYADLNVNAPYYGILIANSLIMIGNDEGITFQDVNNTDISSFFPDVNIGGSGIIENESSTRERD